MNGFSTNTKINTTNGYRFVQDLTKGYNLFAITLDSLEVGERAKPGRVFIRPVTSISKVTGEAVKITYAGETDFRKHSGSIVVGVDTPLLSPDESDFKLAKDIVVGDQLYTEYGDEVFVTAVEAAEETELYTLEVEELDIIIAGAIRVFTGGK